MFSGVHRPVSLAGSTWELLCFQNHPPAHVSQEPGVSIQSLQVSTGAEQEGKSSEERVSPSRDPERDPIVACRAGLKDLDKKITERGGEKVTRSFSGVVESQLTSESRELPWKPTTRLLYF